MIKEKFRKRCLLAAFNTYRWLARYSMKMAKRSLDDVDWFMRTADEAMEKELIIIEELNNINES